jgi:hypothetical protein
VAGLFAALVIIAWAGSFPRLSVVFAYFGALAVSERAYRVWRSSPTRSHRIIGLVALIAIWSGAIIFGWLVLPSAVRAEAI